MGIPSSTAYVVRSNDLILMLYLYAYVIIAKIPFYYIKLKPFCQEVDPRFGPIPLTYFPYSAKIQVYRLGRLEKRRRF